MTMRWFSLLLVIGLSGLLSGCATNPVTGESELALVGEGSELEIGNKQYLPSRQMQGGDYTADPALNRYVQSVGKRLAAVADRKLPYEFVIINDSTPNAWALPGGKIAINRGLLLELRSEAELAAVLSHEIVHAAARHGAQGMERGMLLQGALAVAGVVASNSDYGGLAMGAAALGANLLDQRYSRDDELEADHYGMIYMQRAGYDPQAAVALQETFVRLSEGKDRNWLSGLFASHPPSRERVEKNQQLARELKVQRARVGTEKYRRMTARLRRDKPAYEAYAMGLKQLKDAPKAALKLADRAIAIEPEEGSFHVLRGDALTGLKRLKEARKAYDEAVRLSGGFFEPYLKRGALQARLGETATARQDLQKSFKLLPTADAQYLLGQLAVADGDQTAALKHFQQAAGSRSEVGKAAMQEMSRLDLSNNPARYLPTRIGYDGSGRLLVQVDNRSGATVGDLVVLVGRVDAGGGIYRGREVRLDRALRAGEKIRFRTSISGIGSQDQLRRYAARVVRGRVLK